MNINNKNIVKIIIVLTLGFMSINAHAVKLIGEIGAHIGSETIVTVPDTTNGSYTIDAGGLLSLAIGAQFDLTDNIYIQSLVGWKSDSADIFDEISNSSSTKSISFTRFPIDFMVFYKIQNWNFGAGLTYHTFIELSGNGVPNTQYENSLGYSAEINFSFDKFAYLGVRFTAIDYKEETSKTIINGNSIGVVFGIIIDTNSVEYSSDF